MSNVSKHHFLLLCMLVATPLFAIAQQLSFSQRHGFYDAPFSVQITAEGVDLDQSPICYTLDGSEPTLNSMRYSKPISVAGNTILRAAAVADTGRVTPISTATYLFVNDVLNQSNTPEGYPEQWGSYTQMRGTAIADYEMDPEMVNDPSMRQQIIDGLTSLPVLSIVTDKDNLFSKERDEQRGGIYIFTGPPVGDNTGHGWTRPASVELIGGPQGHDLSVDCGIRLHGGHGRLAEKNPKHSFRLVFKKEYGPATLKYHVFDNDDPGKFDQLVLRCHFGYSWQHWSEDNRPRAQYTRDVWARRMQHRMGHTSANALYVHLFLNGMYWGLYNIAERVDDLFGKSYLGGEKTDIDVVKIEEDGGNHLEASEGDMTAWQLMIQTVARAADDVYYNKLQGLDADGNPDADGEVLLDIDNFIDYMIINQYVGNSDWDHHNWYAIRRRGPESQGFRFICWDSESIFLDVNENVFSKNNGEGRPTGIFHSLMQNERFARRYLKRAKELLADDGLLGQQSVVELWDSLYNTVSLAIYDEAARWGDYRRDVHPYQSRGQFYTVDNHYMTERNRLLNSYFPVRTQTVLQQAIDFVNVDDFEPAADWATLSPSMFHEWDGTGADARIVNQQTNAVVALNQNIRGGGTVAGFSSVTYNLFADLTPYEKMVLRGTGSGLRVIANRLIDHGSYKQIVVSFNSNNPYWSTEYGAIVLPLDDLATIPTNKGEALTESFVHLNAMKVENGSSANVTNIYLVKRGESQIEPIRNADMADGNADLYDLQGRKVSRQAARLKPGIYIMKGKKVYIR